MWRFGQTSRSLKTRSKEHDADCRHKRNKSAIFNHVKDNDHAIDFNNIKILDNARKLEKRLLPEMLFITAQKNSMNIQTDTVKLKASTNHLYIMKNFWNSNISLMFSDKGGVKPYIVLLWAPPFHFSVLYIKTFITADFEHLTGSK